MPVKDARAVEERKSFRTYTNASQKKIKNILKSLIAIVFDKASLQ